MLAPLKTGQSRRSLAMPTAVTEALAPGRGWATSTRGSVYSHLIADKIQATATVMDTIFEAEAP